MKHPSKALSEYYLTNNLLPQQTVEYMEYALHSIIDEIAKLIIYAVVFVILGKFSNYLFILAVLLPVRWPSGGLHSQTFLGCFFYSFVMFTALIYLAPFLLQPNLPLYTILGCLTILSISHVPYTPAFRPITNDRTIRILRSFYICTICFWIAIFNVVELPSAYISSGFYTLLFQVSQLFIPKKGVFKND